MQSRLFVSLLFLGLLALVSAAPSNIHKRSFKVERVRNCNFTGRNGPRALAKAYRKRGVPLPQGLKDALEAQKANKIGRRHHRHHNGKDAVGDALNAAKNSTQQTGSVTTTPEDNDVEYLSPVVIGGQKVNMDFDTGSSDLWVFNTQLDSATTAGHSLYDPASSKTFAVMKGAEFNITYGDGSGASGNVGTDVVDLGGASFDTQAIELATVVSDQFVQDQNNDGLLGLAFSSINTVQPQQQKTFFDNVMDSLAEPLFTADLRHDAVGAYEFGTVDSSKFTGDALTWIPIDNTNGFWQFSSEAFAVDGGDAQPSTPGGQAIADTGTTLLIADPAIVEGYYGQVQGATLDQTAGGVVFPCDAELPDLDLDIGGVYMARIKGTDINFAPVGDGTCFGGLQATAAGSLGVYGDILFKSQFVAFNGGNNTLGMAPHA
ncbi:Fc.00g084170.m01.CDS01 [Cosmosporella sp. VM-42]